MFWRKITIFLPRAFDRVSMYPFIEMAISRQVNENAGKVVFHFGKIETITPTGVIVFSNLIEYFKKLKVKVDFEYYETSTAEAVKYLNDVGFSKIYLGLNNTGAITTKFKCMPLRLIAKNDYLGFVRFELMTWIAIQARIKEERSLAPLRSRIEEVFLNIDDHSGVNLGCTYTQFEPKEDKMIIFISDFGRTIPTLVRENNPKLSVTDHEAINIAWVEGFSTKSNVRNRGAGLHNLIQFVTEKNDGNVLIASGSGEISAIKHAQSFKVTARPSRGHYPGTLVKIILKTSNFSNFLEDTKEEEFEW